VLGSNAYADRRGAERLRRTLSDAALPGIRSANFPVGIAAPYAAGVGMWFRSF